MINQYELIATCYHEAGHTVIGLINSIKINSCIVNKKDYSGWTDGVRIFPNKKYSKKINKTLSHNWIYFNYAGMEVEKYLFYTLTKTKKYPKTIKSSASVDLRCIDNEINKYKLTKNTISFQRKMINYTKKMVCLHWDDICLISNHLYKSNKHKLFYKDLYNILTIESNNSKFWINIFDNLDKIYVM